LVYDGQTYTMDPGAKEDGAAERPAYDVLKANFDAAYEGNRAPLGVGVHTFWFSPDRIRDTQKFVKYALGKPDVYFVTMQTLLAWMQAPVPKQQMAAWLKARCGGAVARSEGLSALLAGPAAAPGGITSEQPQPILSWLTGRDSAKAAVLGRRRLRAG
jgi:hypothetical protein